MRADGVRPNVVTYNTLVDVYGKTGQWERAVRVLDDMGQDVSGRGGGVVGVGQDVRGLGGGGWQVAAPSFGLWEGWLGFGGGCLGARCVGVGTRESTPFSRASASGACCLSRCAPQP
jgi:pentatricopeptide repeat protein